MKNVFATLIILGFVTSLFAQDQLIWSRDFETQLPYYFTEQPSVEVLNDTIEVVGRTDAMLPVQLLQMLQYDTDGNIIESRQYGQDSTYDSEIVDYHLDADRNVYILNQEHLGFYKSKIILQKYTSEGQLLWVHQIENASDTSFTPHSMALVNDTTLMLAVYKEYDYPSSGDDVIFTTTIAYVYGFNINGDFLWKHEMYPHHFQHRLIAWEGTGILSFSDRQERITPNGMVSLVNIIPPLMNGISDIQFTDDGNMVFVSGGGYRLTKLNSIGQQQWSTLYPTNLPYNVCCDEIRAMTMDDGNIFVTGKHYGDEYGTSNYSNGDILTLKYDSDGNQLWENRFEHGVNNGELGNALVIKNGQVYVGGRSQSSGQGTALDYIVLKIDEVTGLTNGTYRYNGLQDGDDAVSSLAVFDDGKVALTGLSNIGTGLDWTTQLLNDIVTSVEDHTTENMFDIYPNPVSRNGHLNIMTEEFTDYIVYSVDGSEIIRGSLVDNRNNQVPVEGLEAGLYLLSMRNEMERSSIKFIVN